MVNSALRSRNRGPADARHWRSCLFLEVCARAVFLDALDSRVGAVFLDLGSSREERMRAPARALAKSLIQEARRNERRRPDIFIRVAPVDSDAIDRDLAALIEAAPEGVLLEEACGGATIQHLSAKLAVHEAEAGLADGTTKILALAAQTPGAVFALGSFAEASSRLAGLVFEGKALQRALGPDPSSPSLDREEARPAPLGVARSLLALAAAAAGVEAIDEGFPDFGDAAALRAQCLAARRDGFTGKMALSLAQVAEIEKAFR
jgi:citrate lyase subunit beta/citryl-CoA lyase